MSARARAALLAAFLVFLAAGCGRKAKPEPYSAKNAPAAVRYEIALSR